MQAYSVDNSDHRMLVWLWSAVASVTLTSRLESTTCRGFSWRRATVRFDGLMIADGPQGEGLTGATGPVMWLQTLRWHLSIAVRSQPLKIVFRPASVSPDLILTHRRFLCMSNRRQWPASRKPVRMAVRSQTEPPRRRNATLPFKGDEQNDWRDLLPEHVGKGKDEITTASEQL